MAGRNDINGMSEFPALMHNTGSTLSDAAATVARAAATTDDTPSNQSVKEAARAWAVEAAQLAARGEEIAALSRQADQAGYQAGEQYAADPNKHMWME